MFRALAAYSSLRELPANGLSRKWPFVCVITGTWGRGESVACTAPFCPSSTKRDDLCQRGGTTAEQSYPAAVNDDERVVADKAGALVVQLG